MRRGVDSSAWQLARACAGPGELSGRGAFRGAMEGDNALPSGGLVGKLNRTVDSVFTVLQYAAKEAGEGERLILIPVQRTAVL